eukprot:CAMPEP_0119326518 /NCGR_PEP_ID=MMETSP1333-20130426/68605_1 /TAXON_ID=418940 /ORGANISM="Scyphosphaera apsteinii, Strain RCC1455" /LENGTH=141 /DNA_ID=CAMNT_0007334845 /DNA_START=18 /DNA_END=443 /DNA_ORIENTATION=-
MTAIILVLSLTASSTGEARKHKGYMGAHNDYSSLATKYFNVWNNHDVPGLQALFADDVTLRDWDISKTGANEVAEANASIFRALPQINIEVLTIHVSEATSTAVCEILVKLNNGSGEVLKVVDIITYSSQGKIKSVRAYRG